MKCIRCGYDPRPPAWACDRCGVKLVWDEVIEVGTPKPKYCVSPVLGRVCKECARDLAETMRNFCLRRPS